MAELLPTGIGGFDAIVGGGLPDKSILLIVGEPGSHYTTFAEQILYNHVETGGKVAYYIVESTAPDVTEDMKVYGWDISSRTADESWIFVNAQTPDIQSLAELVPTLAAKHAVPLTGSLTSLKKDFVTRIKEGRWTALQMLHIILHFELRDVIDFMMYMKLAISVHGGIHFILIPHGIHEEAVSNLKHLADGILEFHLRERAREYEGVIAIRKLRKIVHTARILPFTITPTGIRIERAERII